MYTSETKVRVLSNLTSSDVDDTDIRTIIGEVTKNVNEDINVLQVREMVKFVSDSRRNDINSVNTEFYVRNYRGKFIADTNNDAVVDTSDVTVYLVANNIETEATVSAVDSATGKITLSSAPSSNNQIYITYAWAYANPQTPDSRIDMATACLAIAYCYAKVNWGRAPRQEWRNVKIYRHMQSFDLWESRYRTIINGINSRQSDIKVPAELDPAYYGQFD